MLYCVCMCCDVVCHVTVYLCVLNAGSGWEVCGRGYCSQSRSVNVCCACTCIGEWKGCNTLSSSECLIIFADNEVEVPAALEGNEDAEKKEKEEDENKEGEDEEGENEEEEEEKKDTESKEMNESGMQRDEEEEEEKEEEEEDEEKEEEKEDEGQVEETDESRAQESEQKEGAGGSKASGEEEGAMEITEASGSSSVTDTMQSVVRSVFCMVTMQ